MTWAPDGSIVYQSTAGGTVQIWSVKPDGSGQKRITSEYANGLPHVTPDGKEMVFASLRDGRVNIWKSDRNGGNALAVTDAILAVPFDLSPDGKWIVTIDFKQGTIGKMPIEGGDVFPVSDRRADSPILSPDGKLLAARCWDEELEKTRTYVAKTQEPLKEHIEGHPFPIFDPLNAHNWILYIPLHTIRHSKQMIEVMETAGYPGG